ncbi:MAG TPA: SH3 domain-containing protein, partial [Chitinophagales bacterium]|nr:SH3 domain-containing protein [Chitinophagales bacterium]
MHYGIANQSLIPVRKSADHASEQTTQLLFGELYQVHEVRDTWIRIVTHFDQYPGWIHIKQHTELTTAESDKLLKAPVSVA